MCLSLRVLLNTFSASRAKLGHPLELFREFLFFSKLFFSKLWKDWELFLASNIYFLQRTTPTPVLNVFWPLKVPFLFYHTWILWTEWGLRSKIWSTSLQCQRVGLICGTSWFPQEPLEVIPEHEVASEHSWVWPQNKIIVCLIVFFILWFILWNKDSCCCSLATDS